MYTPLMLKLIDIVVLRSVNPIKIVNRPSVKTLEFLNNLIRTKGIEEFIENARRQYKISDAGLDIRKLVGVNLYDLGDTNINAFKIIADEYVRSTGMPSEQALEIFLLVMFNAIIDLKYFKSAPSDPNEFVFGRRKIADKMWEYSHEVGAIIVPFDVSKTKLKKWIDTNWKLISEDMINNFTSNPFILGIHENLIYEEEIRELKEEKGKSFAQVTEILQGKYPKDKWKLSRVKKVYYDARQRETLQKLKQQRDLQTP
ncbi:MAG: hypothetical protein UU64_C0002G0103 [candidate division WWE3 bacterium GW2011_GWF2_41_45]|uniref:Uncharacterized protein n=2 Tax=Katanobacteria TaxID=422282 RepID=A0A0G0VRP2_UNCKA|nr:MAG: hypothetical protein UU55_C0001G0015 [candidate division WWE3 bacterium GW2011_GWC2_41_23]KKS10701.1 MAG: hypothetical protein UU64_C0002G0103 [candidate division WWE3 bacterium GW2011_GWF2_41_45]KKS12288.1 MAG: hypothetical protein UU68_C0002G0014 [candidate division WWE3 bacterium GW2011_GWF1_41_53]KKS20361.1 MAG: hypothetical protein UU79_C0001G0015 [candidate division WWE3 bacterium GW2011_GWE1_41_72]KKS61331.1 MAG: hypothetical protein UV27_C0002G0010 [candidate division WWE3 bacte